MQYTIEAQVAAPSPLGPTQVIVSPIEGRPIDIAILIPCRNEESAIGGVVAAFRAELPNARIFLYDKTALSRSEGARVQLCATSRSRERAMW
jgi:hypothetical protein